MTPQERDLITNLFQRLREAEPASKDREAEALIRQLIGENQGAPYLLVQTVIVQEQALRTAQARIEELQRQAAPRPADSGSFLGGGFGGLFGSRRPASAPPAPPAPPGPWGAAPQAAGGGFLQSALATAAGVAGGALLFEGISHMFGGGNANATTFGSMTPPVVENTTINNYYSDQSDSSDYDSGSDGGSFFDDV